MKRVLGTLVLGAAAVAGLVGLADVTQNRPDEHVTGAATELVLDVDTRGGYDRELAADGLWAVCQQTVGTNLLERPAANGNGSFTLLVTPPLGEHSERRLVGCLEDATVDRVLADVTSVRRLRELPR